MDSIKSLYKKEGYIDKYGGSIFMSGIMLTVLTGLIGYFYVMSRMKELDAHWTTIRCQPQYIPFAGLIHTEHGKSAFDVTGENFVQCSNSILSEISAYETMPLYYLTEASRSVLDSLTGVMNVARQDFNEIRKAIGKILHEIEQRIESVLVPVRFIFLKQQSMLKKTQGILVTILYVVLSAYSSLRAFIKTFLDIVILTLVALAVAIVILFAMIFSIPAAIAALAVFIAISSIVIPVVIWAENLLAITSPKIPNKPTCFSPSTPIRVYRPCSLLSKKHRIKSIPIKKVVPGDLLPTFEHDDPLYMDRVCAVMELDGRRTKMVNIDGFVVSENHPLIWKGGEFYTKQGSELLQFDTINTPIDVFKHTLHEGETYPAKEIAYILDPKNYQVPPQNRLICLNTLTKSIHFSTKHRSIEALDWDELDEEDIRKLIRYMKKLIHHQETQKNPMFGKQTIDTSIESPESKSTRYISRVIPHQTPVFSKYNLNWIHKYLQGGFHGDSLIAVGEHGETKRLSKICIGDKLVITLPQCIETKNGILWKTQTIHDQVIGIVRIDTSLIDVYSYEWIEHLDTNPTMKCWIGTSNCMRFVKSSEMTNSIPNFYHKFDTTLEWSKGKYPLSDRLKPKMLYHIVTASGLCTVNNVVMYDYNGSIDNLLDLTSLYIPKGC